MKKNVVDILKQAGAIITNDHIVLVSGRHSDAYINPDALLPHTLACSQVGKLFAELYKNANIDVVVGPAYGGIILSQWAAYHLSGIKKKDILGLFTEKTPDKNQIFERGFDKLVKGKRVLVVEDIGTTGGSVRKSVDRVKAAGGKVVAVSIMVNRDTKLVTSKAVGGPLKSLATFKIASYEEKDCPLCKKNIPVNPNLGHGKEFLESRRRKL